MDAVLNLVPDEERIQYSAMTGQSLFHLGETDLQHKILAIAEEEGVRQAAYALKLLQSDGELTMASTGKDEATGNLVTKQYRVKWPVMLMLTTTATDCHRTPCRVVAHPAPAGRVRPVARHFQAGGGGMNLQHERIGHLCEALNLPFVAQGYSAASQFAATQEAAYSDFLDIEKLYQF